MRRRRARGSRIGASLAELLVGVVMFGIIGAAATSALTQQGRVRTRVLARLAGEAQLREAIAPLLADLAAASPAAGDFTRGMATDTTLEFRVTATEGHACGVDAVDSASVYAVPASPMRGRSIASGDSAWIYHRGAWAAAPVLQVGGGGAAPATCTAAVTGGTAPVRVALGKLLEMEPGAALRFTRPVRYSLYRAGDGRTYLGLREWSASLGAFSGQQPVAGPLDRQASRFMYSDTLGNTLADPVAGDASLAQITLMFAASSPGAAAAGNPGPTLVTSVALRNRR